MITTTNDPLETKKTSDTITDVALRDDSAMSPETVVQRISVDRSTVHGQGPAWLHTNLRNLIALVLTGLVCYLAASF